ncbi:MAG TPA: hypothetical protein VMW57_00430 [Methyloceanibacter sp.]|nr:hypothetical protein [Methyloceanibacter sp.]
MSIWLVKATWYEDEVEASEQWAVNAATAQDAMKEVATHLRFHPHHVEAKLTKEGEVAVTDLAPGETRRLSTQ